ncbi:hypothetical protein Hanom_Chr16g01477491 [Helianthus anomalus]|nr:hypothetical protein HanPSC8_Chr16g0724551 [Helianthus annuus]
MPKRAAEDSESLTVLTTDDRMLLASDFERDSMSSSATMDTFSGPNASDNIQLTVACTLQSVGELSSLA